MIEAAPLAPKVASPAAATETPARRAVGVALVVLSLLLLFVPSFVFDPGVREDRYWLGLFAKFMALAVLALSVDLVWGYTGLLSLGQGLYFGLGAYMLAYSLTLQQAAAAAKVPVGVAPPQFMAYTGPAPNDPNYVPPPALTWIAPLGNVWVALAAAVLVPAAAAALFGLITFRMRIKGVYFALVTQALLLAVFTVVRNQQRLTGGVVGIKDLSELRLLGHVFSPDPVRNPVSGRYEFGAARNLTLLVAGVLVACFALCAGLIRTKFGKVLSAIRDNENRALALGYNTALYKTFLFALAGGLAGLAGALFVAANALCDSDYLSVSQSILAVIWVAVGGRGTLLGAVVGTLLVGFSQSYISSAFPEYWPIILGSLFVVVVMFLPRGLVPVAGQGALLGLLLGLLLASYVERSLGLPKTARALVVCPLIVGMVFAPRVVGWGVGKVLAWFGLRPPAAPAQPEGA